MKTLLVGLVDAMVVIAVSLSTQLQWVPRSPAVEHPNLRDAEAFDYEVQVAEEAAVKDVFGTDIPENVLCDMHARGMSKEVERWETAPEDRKEAVRLDLIASYITCLAIDGCHTTTYESRVRLWIGGIDGPRSPDTLPGWERVRRAKEARLRRIRPVRT